MSNEKVEKGINMGIILRWLQISDIHFGTITGRGTFNDTRMWEDLPRYLSNLGLEFDFLICSGDYRYAPSMESNPQNAVDYIKRLAKSISIDSDHIIIVPGNHDLNRGPIRKAIIQQIRSSYTPEDGTFEEEYLKTLGEGFPFFEKLHQELQDGTPWSESFMHCVLKYQDYAFLILNTALTAGGDDDEGNLIIGSSYLDAAISSIDNPSLPVIAIGHHGMEFWQEREKDIAKDFFKQNNLRLYLCGHTNRAWLESFDDLKQVSTGCEMQDDNTVYAGVCVGELYEDGSVILINHKWDIREEGWFENQTNKKTYRGLYSIPEVSTKEQHFSIYGYRLLGDLGNEGIKYIWEYDDYFVESLAFNIRSKFITSSEDLNTSAYTISCSIGCRLATTNKACKFCYLKKNEPVIDLKAEDIALQCIFMANYDINSPSYPQIRDHKREFAFMGQGEPGFNYLAIKRAIKLVDIAMTQLNQKVSRYIISTCGISSFMYQLIDDIKNGEFDNLVTVHFSLNLIGNERNQLMPINSEYNYTDFIRMCEILKQTTGEKIGVSIMMFDDYYLKSNPQKKYTLTEEKLIEILDCLDKEVFRIDLTPVNNSINGSQRQLSNENASRLLSVVHEKGFEGKLFASFGVTEQAGMGMLSSSLSKVQEVGKRTREVYNSSIDILNNAIEIDRLQIRYLGEYNDPSELLGVFKDQLFGLIKQFFEGEGKNDPDYGHFLKYIRVNCSDELKPHIPSFMSYLFMMNEETSDLVPAYEPDVQELLYRLFLLDSGYYDTTSTKDETEQDEVDLHGSDQSVVGTVDATSSDSASQETELAYDRMFEALEQATKIVLKEFEKWLIDTSQHEGIRLFISKHSRRQPAGLQYGYDVGMNASVENERYRLCFECKCYETLKRESKTENVKSINIDNYSDNLIQYFMHCTSEYNNRWILVCPFGDLQANFQELLFDHWNRTHDYLQIFAITEEQSWITCREFLSVDETAYKLVYHDRDETEYPGKGKNEIFQSLYDHIKGFDLVEESIREKLDKYPINESGFLDCKTILEVQTVDGFNAFERVLEILNKIEINSGNEKPSRDGVYIIGEFGTGKSWLVYRIIEQIVRHHGMYSFDPVLENMKDIVDASGRRELSTARNTTIAAKQIVEKYFQNKYKSDMLRRYHRCKCFLFILDGFDEVLSGFSNTTGKIDVLFATITELRKRFPSSLFIVTSRESDYNACKKINSFKSRLDEFYLVQLQQFKEDDVVRSINEQAEKCGRDKERLQHLAANKNLVRIMQTPVFFNFLPTIVERLDKLDSSNAIDRFIVLEQIISRALERLKQDPSVIERVYDCAIRCTRDNLPEVEYSISYENTETISDSTISEIIPTDIMNVRSISQCISRGISEYKCALSFKHNIIREFLVAQKLYRILLDYCNEDYPNSVDNDFCQTLRSLPMTVEMQQLFLKCILVGNNDDCRTHCLTAIETMVCNSKNKEDALLSTKLLELLLQPGFGIDREGKEYLDLSEIQVNNLYIWKSHLKHVNLRNAHIRGLQLIDTELHDVVFTGAYISNLHMFTEDEILCINNRNNGIEWSIVVVFRSGQILQYDLQDLDSPLQYTVKTLTGIGKAPYVGAMLTSSALLLNTKKEMYLSDQENAEPIYQMKGLYDLEGINTIDGGSVIVLSNIGELSVSINSKGSIENYVLGKINPRQFCAISGTEFCFVQDENLYYHKGNDKMLVVPWEHKDCCFTAKKNAGVLTIIVLRIGRLIKISCNEIEKTDSFDIVIDKDEIEIDNEIQFQTVQWLTENAFLAANVDSTFVLRIIDGKIDATELKFGVHCSGLQLGDAPGEKRLQDDDAYRMLKATIRE